MSAGRLAKRARISPGATTSLLDRLESRGLVRRTRDTKDRRRVLVEVTPELRRLGQELQDRQRRPCASLPCTRTSSSSS
jgi:DNA-binding MarR family transcriptional regulator